METLEEDATRTEFRAHSHSESMHLHPYFESWALTCRDKNCKVRYISLVTSRCVTETLISEAHTENNVASTV